MQLLPAAQRSGRLRAGVRGVRRPAAGVLGAGLGAGRTHVQVRLDRGTGICVFAEPLDASRPRPGDTLLVRIEAVDEDLPDTLFAR